MTAPEPITIRGVTYPSASAASRALGLHHSTVSIAKKRGTLEAVGLRNHGNAPITIRGVDYPSIRQAATAIGVSHSTLMKAIKEGTVDGCGLGRGCPVMVRGVLYPNTKACADALGLAVATVQKALRKGRAEFLGLGTGHQESMSIQIRGVVYPSVVEASAALGVTRQAIWSAISRGTIDRVGLGVDYKARKCPGGKPKPVIVGGKRFRSIADLARFIGRPPFSVRESLKAGEIAQGRITRAVLERLAKEEQKVWKLYQAAQQKQEAA